MGMFDGAFDFNDPQSMALLGMLSGVGQAAAPSRMPVTMGQVFGSLAGGAMQGAQFGQQGQLRKQEVTKGALTNAAALNTLAQQAAAWGQPAPTAESVIAGNPLMDWSKVFSKGLIGGGLLGGASSAPQSTAPQLPAAPGQQQSSDQPIGADQGLGIGGALPRAAAAYAAQNGVDPIFFTSAINAESGFNPLARNPTPVGDEHAIGIAQFLPSTAKQYGVDPLNTHQSLQGSAKYYSDLLQKHGGNYVAAAQSYGTLPKDLSNLNPRQQAVYDRAQVLNANPQGTQVAQAGPMTATDAGGMGGGRVAQPANPAVPSAAAMSPIDAFQMRTQLKSLQMEIPKAADDYLSALMMPPGVVRDLAKAQALKNGGLDVIQNLRSNGSLFGADVDNPLGPLRLLAHAPGAPQGYTYEQPVPGGPMRMVPVQGGLPALAASAGAGAGGKAAAEYPFELGRQGLSLQPNGGVTSLLGYPGAQRAIAAAKAGGVAEANAGVEYGNMLPGNALPAATGVPIPQRATGGASDVPPSPVAPAPSAAAAPEPTGTKLGHDLRSVIPPATVQQLPQSPAEAKAMMKPWQDRKDEFADAVDPAQQAEERLLDQASIYKIIETGAWKEQKATIASKLKALGISPEKVNLDDPAAVETALHENYQGTLNYLKTVNNRFTQREFTTLSEYNPNPNLQPTTNLQLLSEGIAVLRRDQGLAKDWETAQKQGWRNPVSWETHYMTANPMGPIVDAVAREIGPLKGMPANATAGGAPYSPTGAGPQGGAPPAVVTKTIGGTTYHKTPEGWRPEIR